MTYSLSEIKAIILAAGRGSRMGNLTSNIPKCMLRLKNKPLISWQIDAINGCGISDIAIVTGFRGSKITFKFSKKFINKKWLQTNMVSSMLCAEEWLSEYTCIVSYSDIVYSRNAINSLLKTTGDIVITYDKNWLMLWKKRFENPLSDAETFKIGTRSNLIEIGGKTDNLKDIKGQYMGLLKFTPRGFQKVKKLLNRLSHEERQSLDMTSMLQRLIQRKVLITAVPIKGSWYEVDTKSDLSLYNKLDNLRM